MTISIKPSPDYSIKIIRTKVIPEAGLPYTVYISFDVDDYSPHNVKKCERHFRKVLTENCGTDIGIYFDRYNLMATLSFRNEDDAAIFMMMV